MNSGITEKITASLIRNGAVASEDADLYSYGIRQGLFMMLNIVTTLIIGLLFAVLEESVIFMIAYIPLRTYAGGYHAKTQLRCYLFSVLMLSAAFGGIKLVHWTDPGYFIITLCAAIIIILLAPLESENKPFNEIEKAVYKKRTHIILSILTAIALIFWLSGSKLISISITMALAVTALMLVLGVDKSACMK